ncbi:hypothetical protein EV702DRAFT_701911 [Suillus placidus]|uniref:Uncharacterized protein n=1 Tax=Suillus placidus TaxID=48579 RepID=A0A9P6ZLR8_9AGAM|nr:hypothetical protein EV702DRAFT_701911 [Suillus placidus]
MPNLQLAGVDGNHTVNQQSADDTNSSFDALIDLLASDDIHDIAVADSHPSHSPHHTVQLRDTSGKLAFDKIRSMFATQNLGPDIIDNKSSNTRPDTHRDRVRAQYGNDIQDVCAFMPQDFTVDGPTRYLAEAVSPGPCRRQVNPLSGGGRDHA